MLSGVLGPVPNIVHGFGTRENPFPEEMKPFHGSLARLRQVHGTHSVEATVPGETLGDADAVFTRATLLATGVYTADCVPILLARKDGAAVAAVHAGWRGTRARILRQVWNRISSSLQNGTEDPKNWVAAIGPAIGPCCYEVGKDLAEEFEREFSEFSRIAVPSSCILDLPAINAEELKALGFGSVDLFRACTRCAGNDFGHMFHSHRRERDGSRQWSGIVIL